ncbi:Sel1 repeat protein [Helicobacter bilis]|nr:Sel1 repeat protein [Helicobacter bilis]
MYGSGQGVKQNKSKAKKLFGDVCDMGEQAGCDAYRDLNEDGVQ